METRGEFDLRTVPGVVRTGLIAGLFWGLGLIVVARVAEGRHPREASASAASAGSATMLLFPILDVDPETVVEGFNARRGLRQHEAIDVPAPRGTPVRAAADGTVHLATHEGAGLTIEQDEVSGRFCLVYAHLDGYAPGLRDQSAVTRGQTIGYVGTSGNAPPTVPHLHFAAHLRAGGGCWSGAAVDPLPLFGG